VVVASAGNDATSRRCYPAAFALEPVPADQVPVISVGALNPKGSKAMFSNDGRWVTAWALGACVISTYPTDLNGSRMPELRTPADRQPPGTWAVEREALDPDDYSAGMAQWSGTSFSAPYAAALVCRSLMKGAGAGLKLDNLGTNEKRRRAVAAYQDLPGDIP
jgi:serine protease